MEGLGFDRRRLAQLRGAMNTYVDRAEVPGLVWLVARGRTVETGAAGLLDLESGSPAQVDSIFRISSMTKPVTAAAAMILVDEGRLRLDDPIDRLLPELADRRVLVGPGWSLSDTVPAARPISVRDLLTFRMGLGADLSTGRPQPSMIRAAELGLGVGPPAPARVPDPDEYLRRLATLPLEHQPGARWLCHTGADVLGVLIARASNRSFQQVLDETVFGPLGMTDTGFSVPADKLTRFGPSYARTPSGDRAVYDRTDGQWACPPAFEGGGAGLVSTATDFLAFAHMLRHRGANRGNRVLTADSVNAMTTNQLTPAQLAKGPDPSGARGWGLGLAVQLTRDRTARTPGAYGWDGGMGTTWTNDPAEDLTALLMTNQLWTSPEPPPIAHQFLAGAYAALA